MAILSRVTGALGLALAAVPAVSPPAAAATRLACAGNAAHQVTAVRFAEVAFVAPWLVQGPNWFSAFEARLPKRNVFDKSAELDPPIEPLKGYVWTQGLYCIAVHSPDGRDVLVRYFARVAAFHEGQSWSPPFRDGLLAAYLVRRDGEHWRAAPIAGERSILLPNTTKAVPAAADLPASDPKTGLPCRASAVWTGERCEAVRGA